MCLAKNRIPMKHFAHFLLCVPTLSDGTLLGLLFGVDLLANVDKLFLRVALQAECEKGTMSSEMVILRVSLPQIWGYNTNFIC